jgi:hypothetical protein
VIFFIAPKQETWCMEAYLRQEGQELAGRIRILTYEEIATQQEIPMGTCIFSAIDQLSQTEREIAELCRKALSDASPGITVINRPADVLCRFDLLTKCFELKRNTFRVMRPSKFYQCQKFPVFIRNERRHTGSITGLLYTRRQLTQALAKAVLQGHRPRDLMIVEYRDTADSLGMFREYCAAIVGDRIIPQGVIHSGNWVTKWSGRLMDAEKARENREYLEGNPHAGWLKETFELAKIRYGRIDYGLRDGVPQVWEINTNPMVVRPVTWAPNSFTPEQRDLNMPLRAYFLRQFQSAMEAVDGTADPNRTVRISVSRRQQRKLEAEKRWLRRGKQWDPLTGRFVEAQESAHSQR